MSHELNIAVAIPENQLIVAAPVLAVLVLLAALVLLKRRKRTKLKKQWIAASEELGIDFVANGSDRGHVARGKVNSNVVTMAAIAVGSGRKKRTVTQYSVKYEAPEAPKFVIKKRTKASGPVLETGNPKFDAVVAIQTDQVEQLTRFLTGPRRAGILRLLTYWPFAEISNREAYLNTVGVEADADKLVDSICHLVAAAEVFDRPTPAAVPAANEPKIKALTEEPATGDAAAPATPSPATTEHEVNGESDLLTEVRLDEVTVLNDLFNADLDEAGITARFNQVYHGRDVTWSGEVLRVGASDGGSQRIAAFIGSADGSSPDSGRVVALTAVGPETPVTEGDVVTFSGSLVNLDASQRLFHVV